MSLYPGLRRVHLLAGLFSAATLLLYGVSAVQMAHPSWLRIPRTVRHWRVEAAAGLADGRAVEERP